MNDEIILVDIFDNDTEHKDTRTDRKQDTQTRRTPTQRDCFTEHSRFLWFTTGGCLFRSAAAANTTPAACGQTPVVLTREKANRLQTRYRDG